MNYLWEFYIRALEQGVDPDSLVFRPARSYSPYMEMALAELNTRELRSGQEVEINPYYRFYGVFKDFFGINVSESTEIREKLFNILLHFIGGNDARQGLCRQEYYNRFLWRDFKEGVFGREALEAASEFTLQERELFLSSVIRLYRIGNSLELFQEVVRKLFRGSIVYRNQEDVREILLYLGQRKSRSAQRKIGLLLEMFIGIEYRVSLYWEYHFCILGVEDTMKMDASVLY